MRPEASQAVERLIAQTPPGSGVILFGSYARDTPHPNSDMDFLVIEPQVHDVHAEMSRLRQALRGIESPIDILVISRDRFRTLRNTPNTVFYEAAREGIPFGNVG